MLQFLKSPNFITSHIKGSQRTRDNDTGVLSLHPRGGFFFFPCVLHFPQGTDVGLSAFVPHMHNAAKTAETGHDPPAF